VGKHCEYCDDNGNISIPHPRDYERIMKMHHVIPCYEERKKIIVGSAIKYLEENMGEVVGFDGSCFDIIPFEKKNDLSKIQIK